MKILKLYRVFGTFREKEHVVVPSIEVAAASVDQALTLARAVEWTGGPVTGLREAGEVVVP